MGCGTSSFVTDRDLDNIGNVSESRVFLSYIIGCNYVE